MIRLKHLGTLEREVMDHLWDADGPQTVREVHRAICAERKLAYTTIMTVLRRLAGKGVVLCTGNIGGNEEMVETFPRCPCAPTVFSTCPAAATMRWAIKWPSGAAPTSSMVLPLP